MPCMVHSSPARRLCPGLVTASRTAGELQPLHPMRSDGVGCSTSLAGHRHWEITQRRAAGGAGAVCPPPLAGLSSALTYSYPTDRLHPSRSPCLGTRAQRVFAQPAARERITSRCKQRACSLFPFLLKTGKLLAVPESCTQPCLHRGPALRQLPRSQWVPAQGAGC